MQVILDFSIVPMGVQGSVADHVAACQRVLREAGLEHRLHATGTEVAGEWDAVMAAIKRCHEVVHQMGTPRIHTEIKISTRADQRDSLDHRVRAVEEALRRG